MTTHHADMPAEPDAKHLLVVDDDKGIRNVLRTFLTRQGYQVTVAEDGEQAAKLLPEHAFHLIISDMVMPNLTGIELLAEVKERTPWVPVIMITGMPEVQAAVQCMKSGAFDYISKPFDFGKIKEVVERALAQAAAQPENPQFAAIQNRFLGHYHIERLLGEGNVGIVFLATRAHDREHRPVALKVLKQSFVSAAERQHTVQRFLAEAEITAAIRHPNIIEILEYDVIADEAIPYLVMEYFDGKLLTHYIETPALLDDRQKSQILVQVASALTAIHERQICHRDIKPHNIMVNRELEVRVMDFGVAKVPESHLTVESEIVGSPAYMAPEGFAGKGIDSRADLFSLGVVAYELYCGARPFLGESIPHFAHLIQHERPISPRQHRPDLPGPLLEVIARLLKKNPADRYQTAAEVERDLQGFLANNQPRSNLLRHLTTRLSRDWK